MPPTSSLLAFSVVAFTIIVIPGPSVMFVISRALSYGRRAALLTVAGNATGFYLQVLGVAAGLGALVSRSITVFTAVKFVGALYLVWLGIQTVRHRRVGAQVGSAITPARSHRALFVDGFVVGVANPKTIVFLTAILPQFVESGGAPEAVQMAVLGMIFVVVALVSDSVWGLGAGTAREWFVRSPRRLERLSGAGGVVIVGLGLRMALTDRAA